MGSDWCLELLGNSNQQLSIASLLLCLVFPTSEMVVMPSNFSVSGGEETFINVINPDTATVRELGMWSRGAL